MTYVRDYFFCVDDEIQKELGYLYQEYGLSKKALNRIKILYRYQPALLGNAKKVLGYLDGLFSDYGYSKEDFVEYSKNYIELVSSNFEELERKLVILNYTGLLECVLFEKPYALLNHKLSASDIYALSKSLKKDGVEVTYDALYTPEYTSLELSNLRELYPLKTYRYDLYAELLEMKRQKLRKDNNASLSYKENKVRQNPSTDK